jgi:tetratricopeptide (TPR) repeat protein
MRDFAKAESLYRMALRANPDNTIPLANVLNILIGQGKWAATDSFMAIEERRLQSNSTYAFHLIVRAHIEGNDDRAEHLADSIHSASKVLDTRTTASYYGAQLAATRGRLMDAERRFRQLGAENKELGSAGPPLTDSLAFVELDAWLRNQPTRAAARVDAALAAHPLAGIPERDRPYQFLARTYAVAGRPDRARAILAQFAQIKDTALYRSRQWQVHAVLGEIAIAEKRYADALTEFRQSAVGSDGRPASEDMVSVHFNLGRTFDLLNQRDSAIAELEAAVSAPYFDRLDMDPTVLAGSHKRLGELYDAKGDRERAISHLSKFVELWKNADPELQPAVADAKRRLAKLQAGGRS